mgnify:CR=1 FL=1
MNKHSLYCTFVVQHTASCALVPPSTPLHKKYTLDLLVDMSAGWSDGGGRANKLQEWSWLPTWHRLSPAERLTKCGTFACHQFNLFLSRKDPAFFARVVRS